MNQYLFFFFLLPASNEERRPREDRFLADPAFWDKYIGQLTFWGHPLAVTRTEMPEGDAALALILDHWNNDDMMWSIARDIAEDLLVPQYTLQIGPIDDEMLADLTSEPPPWNLSPQ
jgi:hypothetical protein